MTCVRREGHCARYIEISKLQIPRSWLDPQPVMICAAILPATASACISCMGFYF